MADVTEADREKARLLAFAVVEGAFVEGESSAASVDSIAAAFAEEREKARAPFLALADEWEDFEKRCAQADARAVARWHYQEVRRLAEDTP